MRAVTTLLCIALWAPLLCSAATVRGVRPDLVDKYAGPTFTCLDGSKTMDISRVNDDFCDCADGSDEPGTSACPNGVFYCRNRGHEPTLLSSSFVDDGICDCCDGTDEARGCKNTCIEKNAAVREGLRAKVAEYKQALDIKAAYVAQAPALRKEMLERAEAIPGEVLAKEREVEQLKAESDRLAAEEAEHAASQPPADETTQQQETRAPTPAHEETAEERGRRIAAQWTSDPEAAGGAAAPAPAASVTQEGQASGDDGGDSHDWMSTLRRAVSKLLPNLGIAAHPADEGPAPPESDGEGEDLPLDEAAFAAVDEGDAAAAAEVPGYDSVYEDPMMVHGGEEDSTLDDGTPPDGAMYTPPPPPPSPAALAAERLATAQAALAALKAEQERLGRQVGMDYGPNGEWLALRSHCVEAREPQYTYRACLFDKAAQVDNGAGHETNLGLWKGFEHSYTEAVFDGGDWCYQAPQRSLRLHISCALSESSWGASEPATCVYASHMTTPVACNEEGLAELQGQLDRLLAEEAALAAEIAADEAAAAAVRDEL